MRIILYVNGSNEKKCTLCIDSKSRDILVIHPVSEVPVIIDLF